MFKRSPCCNHDDVQLRLRTCCQRIHAATHRDVYLHMPTCSQRIQTANHNDVRLRVRTRSQRIHAASDNYVKLRGPCIFQLSSSSVAADSGCKYCDFTASPYQVRNKPTVLGILTGSYFGTATSTKFAHGAHPTSFTQIQYFAHFSTHMQIAALPAAQT